MAGRKLTAGDVPTPGRWIVRGEADEGAPAEDQMLGVEPATDDGPGGWPYLVRQERVFRFGDYPLHLATGIQRLTDAKLMAAGPELVAAIDRLLACPDLNLGALEPQTRAAVIQALAARAKAAGSET